MTFTTDRYMTRRYAKSSYDCLDFARDVWLDLTGEDIGEALGVLLGRGSDRKVRREHRRAFQKLSAPVDPCLVLMQRARTSPHAGVYIRGRVLHIRERGVEFMPPEVASRGFAVLGYYR